MINLLVLSCLVVSVFSQAGFYESLPAILNAQANLAKAVYGNGGLQSTIPSGSSVGNPFGGGFPFNNPGIQNYIQRTLNTALNTNPAGFLTNPQYNAVNTIQSPYAVNPSPYAVNPQNNNVNYGVVPPNRPAPASRRPPIQYPGIKNSLNNANSDLKNIGGPGGGGLNFPFRSFFGR